MALLEEGIRQCQEPDGPYMYADALKEDREEDSKAAGADNDAGNV